MKQNETTSSAVQGVSVERQEMREDFYKRIEQLMNDANDLWERITVLKEDLEEYFTDLDEDEDEELCEEDEELQEALDYITKAAYEIGEGSSSMDCAYEVIN